MSERDSDARIADAHDSLIGPHVCGEPDASATRSELHRVVEDVREDLYEPRAIPIHPDHRRGRFDGQRVIGRVRERHD